MPITVKFRVEIRNYFSRAAYIILSELIYENETYTSCPLGPLAMNSSCSLL
jgi:hypothetical protein